MAVNLCFLTEMTVPMWSVKVIPRHFSICMDLRHYSAIQTGIMNGGTGEGPHMWNIVANNGKYYMADITNSDEGTAGEDGGLFLDNLISGSISRGYTYATDSANIYFAYDKEAKSLYGTENSILFI